MEAKAKRQANWTTDECLFLASEVRDNFQILKGKFGPSLTSKMKKDKWERIAKSLSAQYGSNRSGEQTEKKWSNLLAKAKPIISDHKREIQRTGGGEPPKPLDPITQAIADVIGMDNVSIVGITEHCDASMLQFYDSRKHLSKPTCSFTQSQQNMNEQRTFCRDSSYTCNLSPEVEQQTASTSVYTVYQSDPTLNAEQPQDTQGDVLLSIIPTDNPLQNGSCRCCKEIHDLKVQKLKLEIEILKAKREQLKRKYSIDEE